MKTKCPYCHTYRIEEGERRLENDDEYGDVCFGCEEWLEGDEDGEV